jgi:hypothetical protein
MTTDPSLLEHALNIHHKLVEHFGYPEWRTPLPPLDELVSTILSKIPMTPTVTAPSTP